jgi:hypothetical protein
MNNAVAGKPAAAFCVWLPQRQHRGSPQLTRMVPRPAMPPGFAGLAGCRSRSSRTGSGWAGGRSVVLAPSRSCGTAASYCRIRRPTSDEVIALLRVHLTLHQTDGSLPSTNRRVAVQGPPTGAFPSASPRLSGLWSLFHCRLPQCRRKPGGVTERQFGPLSKIQVTTAHGTRRGFFVGDPAGDRSRSDDAFAEPIRCLRMVQMMDASGDFAAGGGLCRRVMRAGGRCCRRLQAVHLRG